MDFERQLALTVWQHLRVGLEVGPAVYEGVAPDGRYASQSALRYGVILGGRGPITDRFHLSNSVSVGSTFALGNELPSESNDETNKVKELIIPHIEFRFATGASNPKGISIFAETGFFLKINLISFENTLMVEGRPLNLTSSL